MGKIKDKLEKAYRIPCGPVDISADGVCRKSLPKGMEKLLDRLTLETNPTPLDAKLPKGVEIEEGLIVEARKESRDEKKARLIEEGKLRAEVRDIVKQYRESLQGNSKLLQDITGRIQTRYNNEVKD